ncbi:hypothetical protein O7627_04525 [Solwaraspora sp. WMMD1047]|uniref:hypothetical protein n=1 Tax=Solwaraspora sp. WMMD1047 TaxID=3016102 RepID=UPI0024160551|nr:hypothetical protein [Solwaraspora sp. WMMD1047]MDG4828569.1 hypothetical protein [Solwaraspora sp. WMMD1047]
MSVDALDASERWFRTLALAGLVAATLIGGGWWWVANEPAVDGRRLTRGELPGGSWPTVPRGVEPEDSFVLRFGPDDRLVMDTATPGPVQPSGRRRDLRADAWQLLPDRPGLLVADARVVTEQDVFSVGVDRVAAGRYLLEWFCLGRGEVHIWRERETDRQTVECLPSPTAVSVTVPANGEVRLNIRWTSSVAALIGIQISVT